MANKLPYFPWYPQDCDTDERVRGMTDQEFGFYVRCINHSWVNNGLPANIDELARTMGRSSATVLKLWERVGRCFEIRDGRFYNAKQEGLRDLAQSKSIARASASEARWSKQMESNSNAIALQKESYARSRESESESESEKPTTCASSDARQWRRSMFEVEFWPQVWRITAKKAALKVFEKCATTEEVGKLIVAAMVSQKPQYEAREMDKRPYMSTWLNQRRFEDDAVELNQASQRALRLPKVAATDEEIAEMDARELALGCA